jgi:hypothetical protein
VDPIVNKAITVLAFCMRSGQSSPSLGGGICAVDQGLVVTLIGFDTSFPILLSMPDSESSLLRCTPSRDSTHLPLVLRVG